MNSDLWAVMRSCSVANGDSSCLCGRSTPDIECMQQCRLRYICRVSCEAAHILVCEFGWWDCDV